MRILVNALPLRFGGGVTYLEQQMRAFARVAPELEMHCLISPWSQLSGLPGTTETVPVRNVASRFAYEQLRLPRRRTDLLYCPANFGPLASRAPIVLTLQNSNYYRSGLALRDNRSSRRLWKVKANHLAIKRADAVVAISHALAAEASATIPGIAGKLHVIHSGAPEWPAHSTPVPGLPKRYVCVVGSAAPHKRVLDAVAGWARSLDEVDDHVAMVVLGALTQVQQATCRAMADPHSSQLFFTGQIRDRSQVMWIYEHALAMISMSVLEAFPLPPVEAGAVGCPLVLSDIPPHREVALGNAVFVAARDVSGLAEILASEVYTWAAGSRAWRWPTSWDDNARQFRTLFKATAS